MTTTLIAIGIFVISYTAIMSEKLNRMAVALLGAVLMVLFQVLPQQEAIGKVDFNTIGLLIGMMLIVNIIKRTGAFQYMAIKTAKIAKGEPWTIAIMFAAITVVSSAFLDNVTTVLLLAPVTFVITDRLKVNPIPFMIPMIFASNIGGTATIIGDATTIMVGSATHFDFLEFLKNMAPISLISFVVVMASFTLVLKKQIVVTDENKRAVLQLDETRTIKDKSLLIKSMIMLAVAILGFIFHGILNLETATVALFAATMLLLISGLEAEELLVEIEWTTIFFFVGLFILVGGLEKVGVIEVLANQMFIVTHGNVYITAMLILWVGAILSAFINNVPFVAAMIPLIKNLDALHGAPTPVLWFALIAGVCMGGNGTIIGASCNTIIVGMLNKRGNMLGFVEYMKVSFPIMMLSMFFISVYITVWYF